MLRCALKKYRDIFGAPLTGLHQARFLGVAGFDYFLTLLVAFFWTWSTQVPLVITTVVLLILGEFLHYVFCIDTAAVRWMFGPA